MADNTQINPMTGGDVIATAETTSLNGSPTSGVKVERVKVGYGQGATHQDVSPTAPLPVDMDDLADLLVMILGRLGVNNGLGRMLVDIGATGTVAVSGAPTVAQSGTWTVQPGNTQNTTAWLVQPPVAFVSQYGIPNGLDQHYQSLSAYTDGVRSKITAA